MGVPGVIAANSDGTANIYINTLYCEEKQQRTIKHELRHLAKNHFYCDWMTIAEKELDASDIDDPSFAFSDDFSSFEYTEVFHNKNESPEVRVLPGSSPQISVFRSKDLPEDVSFAFYIPDNALKPYLKKGDIALCDSYRLRPGDIGLFSYNGKIICRQYYKDIFGITYLFSVDRKKSKDDIILTSDQEKFLRCIGRLRIEKRVPLPGL